MTYLWSGHPASRQRLAAVGLVVTALVGILTASGASAQQATEGTISGVLTMGTAGAVLAPDASVELIELQAAGVTSRRSSTDDSGRYTFTVPVDPDIRYIPRIEYQGVQYFGPAVVLTADAPDAEVGPITVYESTDERPHLAITETVMTAIALDRAEGQIGFIREDLVVNPVDRAYVGGEDRVTIRLPVPEGTLEAAGENQDGKFALQEGVLTT
ncbi:MAG: hypothetical protein DWG82_03170, partial [Chloroflexi bacterium]|nr:hypothetical protein [Chloroflexota bacterium]